MTPPDRERRAREEMDEWQRLRDAVLSCLDTPGWHISDGQASVLASHIDRFVEFKLAAERARMTRVVESLRREYPSCCRQDDGSPDDGQDGRCETDLTSEIAWEVIDRVLTALAASPEGNTDG